MSRARNRATGRFVSVPRKSKVCGQCGTRKILQSYYRDRRTHTVRYLCKGCSTRYVRKWRKCNTARHKLQSRRNGLRRFGLTISQYDEMLKRQGGVCAVCGYPPRTRRLAVDHDHGVSKRVRCLVCYNCNRNRIGTNTVETARRVLALLDSDFDGRKI